MSRRHDVRSMLVGLSLGLFACALPVCAAAQGVAGTRSGMRGFVRDSSARPVAGADIRTGSSRTTSGEDGTFFIPGEADGTTRAVVRKLGFHPAEVVLRGSAGTAPMVDTVTLVPRVPTLDEVVVKGVPYNKRLWDEGFYRRQRGNRGTFFDETDVRLLTATGLAPLLRAVPRVEVAQQGPQDFAIGYAGGRSCYMHIYIDRAYQWMAVPAPRMGSSGSIGLRELIDPAAIYAVEVYPTPVSVPPEFTRMATGSSSSGSQIPSRNTAMKAPPPANDANAPCGAIVIWTKGWVERQKAAPD